MDALFMVGSACFALGSTPGFSSAVAANVVALVFFVGSLFFTSAATLQYLQTTDGRAWAWQPRNLAWAAAIIQLVGTLWFNIDTFAARRTGLDAQQDDLRIWTPDYLGSVCFLVASGLAVAALSRPPWQAGRSWRVAGLNLLGSVFFMAAAVAAFVLPDSDDLLDATVANSGTFLGALCFLVAARIEITPTE
jgi:YrhK-like protein